MNNTEFNTSPNKSDDTTINSSEITKNEKMILGILLFILSLLLIVVGQKILKTLQRVPIVHNSIIVSANRYDRIISFSSMRYIFSIEQSNKINIKLPNNLGDDAEWSPDGQWIVFRRRESKSNIYIMRTDGSQRTLVPILYGAQEPTWSPDGKQIAFFGYGSEPGIYIANIECLLRGESCAPEFRLLVEAPVGYSLTTPDWSPDGRKIAYTGRGHISIVNVDGQGQVVELSPYFSGRTAQPQWSPDGTEIAGICYDDVSGVRGVCIMKSDGSHLVFLTRNTSSRIIHQPRWSPDGQKIAYIAGFSNRPVPSFCINPDGCGDNIYPTSVFIMNADGSETTSLPLEDDVVTEWFFWYP